MKSCFYRKSVVFTLIALFITAFMPLLVWACNTGTVRDDAFTARRDQYRLCFFAEPGVVQESDLVAMNQWISGQEERFNLSLEVVDVRQSDMRWDQYGLPGAPEETPVTLLIGATGISPRAFVVQEWKGLANVAQVQAFLASPTLDKAKETLVEQWGVLLYSPAVIGEDADTKATLEGFVKSWSAEHPPGISLLEFNRTAAEEALLAALIGPRDEQAWAAMLFGRCKLLAPPLMGEDITQDSLEQVLSQLIAPCTCVEQSKDIGLDLPVFWDLALEERFIALEELAQTSGGYMEITFEDQIEELQADIPDNSYGIWLTLGIVVLVLFHIFMLIGTFAGLMKLWRRFRNRGRVEDVTTEEKELEE